MARTIEAASWAPACRPNRGMLGAPLPVFWPKPLPTDGPNLPPGVPPKGTNGETDEPGRYPFHRGSTKGCSAT